MSKRERIAKKRAKRYFEYIRKMVRGGKPYKSGVYRGPTTFRIDIPIPYYYD